MARILRILHVLAAATALVVAVGAAERDGARANGWEHTTVPIEALFEALRFDDPVTRARAAESLGYRREPEAFAPLRAALERPEDDPNVRSAIYTALGALGDPRAVPVLQDCLDREQRAELRAECVAALGRLAQPESLPRIIAATRDDPSILVRSRAVDALGHYD
ncbi:MAG: HEAT repeat domain-containing protein, partial [Alphaproteobacteria bacterium]